jgi:hypothetical protein
MTLNDVKNAFNKVSLQAIDIKEFYEGNAFDAAISPKTVYPITFLEIPYNINYPDDRKFKTYQFAFLVLKKIKQDSAEDAHNAISWAEELGDAILSKIQNDYKKDFLLTGINALSLDNYSDDYLGGVRYNLTVTVIRDLALPKCYEAKFNQEC